MNNKKIKIIKEEEEEEEEMMKQSRKKNVRKKPWGTSARPRCYQAAGMLLKTRPLQLQPFPSSTQQPIP